MYGTRLIPAHAGKTVTSRSFGPGTWAHPRSRGENCSRAYSHGSGRGSSPLTRGKHFTFECDCSSLGLIPAHAGKTRRVRSGAVLYRAHPRSRGENSAFNALAPVLEGSSPLTRGKQAGGGFDLTRGGLIPAHAGKTQLYLRTLERWGAHPRSRGENSRSSSDSGATCGSSPLTRGKRVLPGRGSGAPGLIPAHAGKTDGEVLPELRRGAHPRSRGENVSKDES